MPVPIPIIVIERVIGADAEDIQAARSPGGCRWTATESATQRIEGMPCPIPGSMPDCVIRATAKEIDTVGPPAHRRRSRRKYTSRPIAPTVPATVPVVMVQRTVCTDCEDVEASRTPCGDGGPVEKIAAQRLKCVPRAVPVIVIDCAIGAAPKHIDAVRSPAHRRRSKRKGDARWRRRRGRGRL